MKNLMTLLLSGSLLALAGAIVFFALELRSFSQTVPEVVSEIKLTREEIPQLLDRAEGLVGSAKNIARESSSGIIPGIVEGAISAPFDLVSSIFSSKDEKLSKTDTKKIGQAASKVLASNKLRSIEKWENPKTGRAGSVQLVNINDKKMCRSIQVITRKKGGRSNRKTAEVCRDSKGQWRLQ